MENFNWSTAESQNLPKVLIPSVRMPKKITKVPNNSFSAMVKTSRTDHWMKAASFICSATKDKGAYRVLCPLSQRGRPSIAPPMKSIQPPSSFLKVWSTKRYSTCCRPPKRKRKQAVQPKSMKWASFCFPAEPTNPTARAVSVKTSTGARATRSSKIW